MMTKILAFLFCAALILGVERLIKFGFRTLVRKVGQKPSTSSGKTISNDKPEQESHPADREGATADA